MVTFVPPLAAAATASALAPLVDILGRVDDPAIQRDVLQGMHDAMEDLRGVPMPRGWRVVWQQLVAGRSDRTGRPALGGLLRNLASVGNLIVRPPGLFGREAKRLRNRHRLFNHA